MLNRLSLKFSSCNHLSKEPVKNRNTTNRNIDTGICPTHFKCAKVIPIFMSGVKKRSNKSSSKRRLQMLQKSSKKH